MSSARSVLRPMKICRMNGSQERAVSPSEELLVGTVRQPRKVWPSDWMICSKRSSSRRRLVGLRGRKHEPAAVFARAGQGDARLLARFDEERVGHLQQHAGAIAGVGLAAAGAAVVEVLQHLDRLLQDLVRLAALDVDHEADAAGVVLEPGIVEALLGRQAGPSTAGRLECCHFGCSFSGYRLARGAWSIANSMPGGALRMLLAPAGVLPADSGHAWAK